MTTNPSTDLQAAADELLHDLAARAGDPAACARILEPYVPHGTDARGHHVTVKALADMFGRHMTAGHVTRKENDQ